MVLAVEDFGVSLLKHNVFKFFLLRNFHPLVSKSFS
ncbi:unnamed protein product [Arabidopsis halleri]